MMPVVTPIATGGAVAPVGIREAAERAWRIKHLFVEGAVDFQAAGIALESLYQRTDSERVRNLLLRIGEDLWRIVRERQAARVAALPEPTP